MNLNTMQTSNNPPAALAPSAGWSTNCLPGFKKFQNSITSCYKSHWNKRKRLKL